MQLLLPYSLADEDALARRLRVEELVGAFGIVQLEPVREERVEVNAVVDDELRALGLADAAEGP